MNRKICMKHAKRLALGLAALAIAATPSFAQTTIDLCATTGSVTMPDTTVVPIWGYVAGDCTGTSGTATLALPPLAVTPGDATLTINLYNDLGVETSIFVPGLAKDATDLLAPQTTTDGDGRERLTSFDKTVGAGLNDSYTWSLTPGTYLFHSGTDIRTQVPMGLYGALVVDSAAGQAYADVSYAQDEVLVYSQIDPNLNAAPAAFGGARVINWNPQYFLINGEAQPDTADINIGVGEDVLLRFVNAGLKTVMPTLDGGLYMDLVAEDGNRYPQPLQQYGIELQAGKTVDAIVNAGTDQTYALYDRAASYDSGVTDIIAGVAAGAPTAANDNYPADEDTQLVVVAIDGVLSNDTPGTGGLMTATLVSDVSAGTLVLAADGSFTYDPNADFNGIDLFTYVANDGGPDSNVATVTITVTAANDDPVAVADFYDAVEGETLMVAAPGVLGNDIDVDGDGLTAVLDTNVTNGVLALSADGSFTYDPAGLAGSADSFTYHANDGIQDSNVVTVTLTIVPPAANIAPIANDDFAAVDKNSDEADPANTFSVTANDIDVDGTVDPATVVLPAGGNTQRGGTVVENGDGTVTYVPKKGFRGTDTFEYNVKDDGVPVETSTNATVRINVS